MHSIWTETANLPQFDALKKDVKTDVLIIGGGMAGILTAYMLERIGIDYILVEAERIGGGITKNTTAKLTFQHGLIYQKLLRSFGPEKARMYLDANRDALAQYRNICKTIDCDFQEKDAFVYTLKNRRKIEKEIRSLEQIGYQADFVGQLPLPFQTAGAIRFKNQAQFHPLKFLAATAQGLHIYENTRVRELVGYTAVTNHGKITADNIIVTTHFPFLNKHGSYFLKLYQHRSYVIALENAPDIGGMYLDEAEKGMSFRNHNGLLFVGGGDHRTGKQGGNWAELETFAKQYYPGSKIVSRWATQDCMSLDHIPYIGRYAKHTSNLYVASGFNKWGMTSAMVSARLLTDLIAGKCNPYAAVFFPSRSILHPQLAANAFEATANLLTISDKRCPHMGCALKWNPQEHSWDCPCHGSRFTEKGKLIDNPATGDLKQ